MYIGQATKSGQGRTLAFYTKRIRFSVNIAHYRSTFRYASCFFLLAAPFVSGNGKLQATGLAEAAFEDYRRRPVLNLARPNPLDYIRNMSRCLVAEQLRQAILIREEESRREDAYEEGSDNVLNVRI